MRPMAAFFFTSSVNNLLRTYNLLISERFLEAGFCLHHQFHYLLYQKNHPAVPAKLVLTVSSISTASPSPIDCSPLSKKPICGPK
jgi:hypothetical protein